jgi:small subunit ribosomal protein S6
MVPLIISRTKGRPKAVTPLPADLWLRVLFLLIILYPLLMAKNKSSRLPRYELLYIVSNKFTAEETEPIAQKIEDLITANNGTIVYRENWGKRRMSYPIKGFQFGYYRLVECDLAADKIAEVERFLRLSSDILRHQIVKRQPRTVEEILAAKEDIAKREAKLQSDKTEAEAKKNNPEKEVAAPASDSEEVARKHDQDIDAKIDTLINEEPIVK